MKINRTELAKLTPPESGRVIHWDDSLPGFGARITANGVISFVIDYRLNGKQRQMTLGRLGKLTPEQYRKEARKRLGEIAQGIDPLAEKRKQNTQNVTLREAFEAYLADRKSLKPTTIDDISKAFNWGIKDWMPKSLLSISPDMVKRRHQKLGQRSPARANLTMRYLRAVFNYAIAEYADSDGQRLITSNPVTKLSEKKTWFRVERRQTVIKRHDIQPWFRAVLSLNNPLLSDYFILVLLTGLRRSEALGLQWSDIDINDRTLTVRDTKNHTNHTLPLSDYLYAMLSNMERTGDYVFQSGKGRLSNFRYAFDAIQNETGFHFTIHDLRRTFATVADSLDIPGYTVKALLNHKNSSDVTAGYIVTDVERLRQPMQRITDFFLKEAGIMPESKVIQFKQV